jgi:hypothetical protein
MIWDPRRRVYVHDNGTVVSPAELRDLIESYIEREKQEVDSQAQSLVAGAITSAFFFDWLRDKVKEVHGAAGLVAYGGEDQMNDERWARIGEKVASESAYVAQFEQDFQASERVAQEIVTEAADALEVAPEAIDAVVRGVAPSEIATELATKADVDVGTVEDIATKERIGQLIFGQTPARSQLYMESIYGTHENSVMERESDAGVISGRRVCEEDGASCDECVAAASEDFMPLDEILDIGAAVCMSNCRCTIEFDYSGVGPLTIDRSIYAPGFANA